MRLRLRMRSDLWPECQNLLTVASLSSNLASLHLPIVKWRRGIAVSVVVRAMNEVRPPVRGTRLVLRWMTVFGQLYYDFGMFTFLVSAHLGSPGKGPLNGCCCCCRYVISQLGQLSVASLRGRLTEYQLRLE